MLDSEDDAGLGEFASVLIDLFIFYTLNSLSKRNEQVENV